MQFKEGDLVYCKKFDVMSLLRQHSGTIYTVEIAIIGRTYTSTGFHVSNDTEPSLVKLETYLTRRICEKIRRSLN